MKTGLSPKKRSFAKWGSSEKDIHQWLDDIDLSALKKQVDFHPASFKNLQPTDWEKVYASFEKTKPISIRLPVYMLHLLKIHALQRSLPYQALVRMWLAERLQEGSKV